MEKFYATFVLREAIARLDAQRDAIIAATYANSVYEEHKEAKREEVIQNVERHFDQVIASLKAAARGETDPFEDEEDDFDESNPFWAAMRRNLDAQMDIPRADEDGDSFTVGELVETEQEANEIRTMLSNLDQN